jgi:hypothetical protein
LFNVFWFVENHQKRGFLKKKVFFLAEVFKKRSCFFLYLMFLVEGFSEYPAKKGKKKYWRRPFIFLVGGDGHLFT